MEKVECIVVGAGPSGTACALSLARMGIETVMVERGADAGDKNVAGFVLMVNVLKELIPDFIEKGAPLERVCTAESFISLSNQDFTDLTMRFDSHYTEPIAYTAFRSKFDSWFAKQAEKEGAEVLRGACVTGLIMENGKVAGIKVGDEELRADVVVGADGFHSVVSREAGLYEDDDSKLVLHTVREVIDLPPDVITDRMRVRENEGTIYDGWGYPLDDVGSWFTLYPNHDSVSISLMCSTKALKEKGVCLRESLEDLKAHPYIAGIIKGGKLREYQSHILGLAGRMKLDETYSDGVLLVGEAGGFQTAFCVGVPCGMLSGITAAKAIESAHKQGKYDRETLGCYKDLLFETGLPRTLYAAKSFHEFMLGKGFNNMGEFMGKAQIFLGEFVDDEVDFLDPERWPSTKHMYEYFLQPYLGKYKKKIMNPIMKYVDSSGEKREIRKLRREL